MDIVLGVSVAPTNVRLVVIEGQDADGVTVEQDEFDVASAGPSGAVDQVIAAIDGTREGAKAGGYHLVSTGVTWTDPAEVGALREAVAAHDLGTVMLVSPLLAAAALAQTVGQAIGYEHIAMLFVEPRNATLAVVDVADGSIVDLHRHQLVREGRDAVSAELAAMVAGLDAPGARADGVFLVGCGTDIVPLKPALEAATSLEVTAPEEPDMTLARGAALASGNAPLFASTTAAMAYALDPGTGEVNPRALTPTYLDVSGNAEPAALAYSAVDEDDDARPRRGRSPFVLAGGALAAVAAVVAGVLVVSLASDRPASVRHDPSVGVATPGQQAPPQAASPPPQAPSPPPSPPPQAQVPAPSPSPPPPSTAQAAAPSPPASQAPVEQPAPQPASAPPVHRAPPRRAPEYVPTPVQQAQPAPAPAAPAPAPPPAAPQQPQQPPMTMYLHFPFVTVPIPITPPAPPPPAP